MGISVRLGWQAKAACSSFWEAGNGVGVERDYVGLRVGGGGNPDSRGLSL